MIIFFCAGVHILKLYLLCSACISSFSSSPDEVFAKSIVTGNFSRPQYQCALTQNGSDLSSND